MKILSLAIFTTFVMFSAAGPCAWAGKNNCSGTCSDSQDICLDAPNYTCACRRPFPPFRPHKIQSKFAQSPKTCLTSGQGCLFTEAHCCEGSVCVGVCKLKSQVDAVIQFTELAFEFLQVSLAPKTECVASLQVCATDAQCCNSRCVESVCA